MWFDSTAKNHVRPSSSYNTFFFFACTVKLLCRDKAVDGGVTYVKLQNVNHASVFTCAALSRHGNILLYLQKGYFQAL